MHLSILSSGILISGFSQGFDSSSGFSFFFQDFVLKQWTKCKKKCAFGVRNLWWIVLNFSAFLSFFLGFLDLLVPLFCYLSLQEMLLHCSSSWLQCMYHLRTPFGSYKSANFWSFFNSFLLKGVVLFDSWTCFYNLFYSLLAFILYIYLINLTDIFYYWEVVNLC